MSDEKGHPKLIEGGFPLEKINIDSAFEASFRGNGLRELKEEYRKLFGIEPTSIRVKLSNLHPWFARRPTSPARALTLAAALPDTDDARSAFMDAIGVKELRAVAKRLGSGLLLYANPDRSLVAGLTQRLVGRRPEDIVVVDPMAGGGAIPLESLRLGFRTIAIEYNPVAYLILKATVEFPAKYADSGLFDEVLREARQLIGRAKEGLSRYFGEDAENYTFARGIRCPYCGGLIPIQGVAPELAKSARLKGRYLKIEFDKDRKTFTAYTTDSKVLEGPIERVGKNVIRCPYCGNVFALKGERGRLNEWFKEHAKLMKEVVEDLQQVSDSDESRLIELHIPLVKQTDDGFVAIWDDKVERGKFFQAFKDLSDDILNLQDYIPVDDIPADNRWASPARSKGLSRWYMLFNPRQLLVLAALSRLVAERAESLVSSNGEFGAAIALYLALGIDKLINYNTIATHWIGAGNYPKVGHTFTGLSTIDFRDEYCEVEIGKTSRVLEWAFEPDVATSSNYITETNGGLLPVLRFLTEAFRGASLGDRISVYMGDATELSAMLSPNSVDIVNVDPPYFDQVIYSDRSELFWAILRRSLRPALEVLFRPGLRLSGWSWTSPTVPRDREVVSKASGKGRGPERGSGEGQQGPEGFRQLFKKFVGETYKVLKDDGTLVLWFTHPTELAWRIVGETLYSAGYVVSAVWPIRAEMKTRYKGQVNAVAQETSLIIVARKYDRFQLRDINISNRRSLLAHPLFVKAAEEMVSNIAQVSKEAMASPADMISLMLGGALAVATRFDVPNLNDFNRLFDAAATKMNELLIQRPLQLVLARTGYVKLSENEARGVMSYVSDAMLDDAATRSYLTLWFLSRVDMNDGNVRDVPLPLNYDFAQTVAKLLGYDIKELERLGLIRKGGAQEQKVGRVYYPALFEVLALSGAKATPQQLLSTTPGRAIFIADSALRESGLPSVRANAIRSKLTWDQRALSQAAAVAVVLLETAHDSELGFGEVKPREGLDKYLPGYTGSGLSKEVVEERRGHAIRTLLKLMPDLSR